MSRFEQSPFWQAATGLPSGVYAGQTLAIVDKTAIYPQDDDLLDLPVAHLQKSGTHDFKQQNLALHVGDDAQAVQHRRAQLLQQLQPFDAERLQWLNQTHSTTAYTITDQPLFALMDGDGLVTKQQGVALMMMTADCLPIVVSNAEGTEVACMHAGWRGLANGIVEATLAQMQTPPALAWIGAAISQPHFEVGAEVKDIFVTLDKDNAQDFIAKENGKYLADLYSIATRKLHALGVSNVAGADRCSFAEPDAFYSYRRQSHTGRMATFVFIAKSV